MKTVKVTALKSFRHIYPDGTRVTASRGEKVEVSDIHFAELERAGLVAKKMDSEHENKMLGTDANQNKQRLPEINTQSAESPEIRTQGRINATGDAPAGAVKTVDAREAQAPDAKKADEKPKASGKPAAKPADTK
jgi:hypothetical protein